MARRGGEAGLSNRALDLLGKVCSALQYLNEVSLGVGSLVDELCCAVVSDSGELWRSRRATT